MTVHLWTRPPRPWHQDPAIVATQDLNLADWLWKAHMSAGLCLPGRVRVTHYEMGDPDTGLTRWAEADPIDDDARALFAEAALAGERLDFFARRKLREKLAGP